MAKCIEIFEVCKFPHSMVAYLKATILPGCPLPSPPLYKMYRAKEPDDPRDLVGGQVLSHRWIDPGMLERWKSTCNGRHAGLCKGVPQESLRRIRPTWLIDAKLRCVIPAPDNRSFVALSYVWGNQSTVKATLATMGHLQRVRALSNTPIAKTIEYAMGITELLDEKYLCVDDLCILQDDESQKHIEMSKMAAIYANSAVTILAVEGRHANSGLKGFHGISEARNLCQSFHRLAEGTEIILFPMGLNQLELGAHQTD